MPEPYMHQNLVKKPTPSQLCTVYVKQFEYHEMIALILYIVNNLISKYCPCRIYNKCTIFYSKYVLNMTLFVIMYHTQRLATVIIYINKTKP